MKIIVTADDYGLTRGITDTILESVDRGAVNCVSIIANGDDFDHAIQEARRRPEMQVALHLNLTDGAPCADIAGSELVGSDGKFYLLFQTLWLRYFLSSRKKDFSTAIKQEVCAQIKKVQQALQGRKIFLNGHDHVHMIPCVFDVVASVAEELGVAYVRIPEEPLFFDRTQISAYAGGGIIKHALLNMLSRRARARMREKKRVETPDAFVGILFTGRMSESVVRAAFKKILRRAPQPNIIEVLFHPGRAAPSEHGRWPIGGRTSNWFFSDDRRRELNEVCKPEFKILLDQNNKTL